MAIMERRGRSGNVRKRKNRRPSRGIISPVKNTPRRNEPARTCRMEYPVTPSNRRRFLTLTAAAFSIAFTATPLPAATYLLAFASPQRSAGRDYEGDYRFMKVSTAAQASPLAILTEYTAKFGVPITGNKIFVSLVTATLGFVSGPFTLGQVVA
jgi:hypothetical protein